MQRDRPRKRKLLKQAHGESAVDLQDPEPGPAKRPAPESINCILEAVQQNDLARVQAYLQAGGNVNEHDVHGITPLMVAVKQVENWEMIHSLVEAGADIDACDNSGRNVIDRIPIPPEPPESWENGHEAWTHSDELFVIRYLLERRNKKRK